MRISRRRSTLAALTAGLLIALLPTAADACDDRHPRPGHGGPGHSAPAPAPRPGPGVSAPEFTAVYVYKKLDARQPASWQNSGEQHRILLNVGLKFVDSISPSVLPSDVCGDGWAIQQDQIRGLEESAIPVVVDRQTNTGVLGSPVLVAYRHEDLSRYMDVPECNPDVPVEPVTPPTDEPVTPPTDEPVTPPTVEPAAPTPATPVVVKPAQAATPVLAAPAFTG